MNPRSYVGKYYKNFERYSQRYTERMSTEILGRNSLSICREIPSMEEYLLDEIHEEIW